MAMVRPQGETASEQLVENLLQARPVYNRYGAITRVPKRQLPFLMRPSR